MLKNFGYDAERGHSAFWDHLLHANPFASCQSPLRGPLLSHCQPILLISNLKRLFSKVIIQSCCFLKRGVRCQGTNGAFGVILEDGKAIDIACIDPSESVRFDISIIDGETRKIDPTYPSRGTPLKSLPWLPYSASTLCGSSSRVTLYFSTTIPLKSTNALTIMKTHL